MKKAVILGCNGQVGSYMADYLLSKKYKVTGVVRRSNSASLWRLQKAKQNKNFELIEGDITDLSSLIEIFSKYKPDEVYNFAAQSHVATSFSQPTTTWDVTGQGGLNVLEALRLSKLIEKTKLYQASSSEQFGYEFTYDKKTKKKYQDINTNFFPQSPYSCAKLAVHHAVRIYRQSYGLYGCCGITFNTESPRRSVNFVTRKITRYFHMLKNGNIKEKLRLGNLDSYRDWGYAPEYVVAMHAMLQQKKARDYVICTGKTYKVSTFLEEVGKLHGLDPYKYTIIDESLIRPSEVDYLCGNPEETNKLLDWYPKVDFKDLVKLMVENENGLE